MLLFSTILPMREGVTEDDFIRLVVEWNNTNDSHGGINIIPGVVWNGERNVRYGNENLWMRIEEYGRENIIAVRYEKRDADTVWDTDYIANFKERRVAICLDRSFLEEALNKVAPGFSTPHFIDLLVERGFLEADGGLSVDRLPVMVSKENQELLAGVMDGTAGYRLPIVYVSRTDSGEEPLDAGRLAHRLKGVAHVLVAVDKGMDAALSEYFPEREVCRGASIICYPNAAKISKFTYRRYRENPKGYENQIVRDIVLYGNSQRQESLYTWMGVHNALLRDSLEEEGARRKDSENRARELDALIGSVDDEIKELKQKIVELTHDNERLFAENQGLHAKLGVSAGLPVLCFGNEEEFFKDEIKAILIETLEDALKKNMAENTRRYDVVKDVIENNACEHTAEKKGEMLKRLLGGYKDLSPEMKRELSNIGIEIPRGIEDFAGEGGFQKASFELEGSNGNWL